jgi:DNA-binding transcriptional LysR family regulator
VRDELSVLSAFLAVADERSFTRAAKRLNVSTSGVSQAIRKLEEQIGVRLLTRTTRSVSPTDAGEQLLAQLRPALSDIRGVLTTLSGLQSTPVGRIRLLCPRLAAKTIVGPKLGQFVRDYPGVELEITTDDSRVDLVSAGYDAASSSGNTSRRTWWLFACHRISDPPSSAHPRILTHTLNLQLRETC